MLAFPKTPLMSAVSQVIPNATKNLIPAVVVKSDQPKLKIPTVPKKVPSLVSQRLSKHGMTVSSGITCSQQVRYLHSDLAPPDFSAYRRKEVSNTTYEDKEAGNMSRKMFSYMLVGTGGVLGAYTGKEIVGEFISSVNITADVKALASVEVDISQIAEGQSVLIKWRGKPLFIRHRTAEEIEQEASVSLPELRDPQHDCDRSQFPEWMVLVGICTHLGCVPMLSQGDYAPGGYYCPCHGSHYDSSGRIRRGPAPLNLEVAPHAFNGDLLVIG